MNYTSFCSVLMTLVYWMEIYVNIIKKYTEA